MRSSLCRKLTVSDAMVLIASLAIGLAWVRAREATLERDRIAFPFLERNHERSIAEKTWGTVKTGLPCLIMMMPAFFVLSLRNPRPGRRVLSRQPGVMACGSASLVLCWELSRS